MKKIFYTLFITTLANTAAVAFSPSGLKTIFIGPKYSNFRSTNSQYILGFAVSFECEKSLTKYSFFSWGVLYSMDGAILRNKFIHPTNSVGQQQGSNFISDIHVLVSFLQFHIHLNFLLYSNNSARLSVYSGPQISFALKDFTELKNKRASPIDDPYMSYSYSDVYNYETNSIYTYLDKAIKLGYNWGVSYQYRAISFHLRYSYLKQKFESSDKIRTLNKKIHGFNFLFGYHF